MKNNLNKILINKILFSKNSKNKIIRSFILIVLIVSLLTVSSIFIHSMSEGISTKFALLVNGDVEIYSDKELTQQYDFIKKADTVASITALLYGKEDTQISSIKAVNDDYFNEDRLDSLHIEQIENTTNLPSIIISEEISEALNLKIGDRAALILAKNEKTIRPKLVFIRGIYNSGYKEIDENFSYMKLEDLKLIYQENLRTHQELLLKDNISIEEAVNTFEEDGLIAYPWYKIQQSVYQNLLTSTQSLSIVFLVIALLTGYFISSISSDLITKDHRTIATNKLLGLKNKVLQKNYFLAIELFTIVSTFVGSLLGLIISKTFLKLLNNINVTQIPSLSWYLFDFEIIVPYKNIFFICLSLIFVSVISVYLSLRRIKKIEVLDLLNHE